MTASDHDDLRRFQLAPEMTAALEAVARAAGRTPDWLIERALRRYFAEEGADILSAAKGRAEFEAGQSEDFDDVLTDLETILHGKAA